MSLVTVLQNLAPARSATVTGAIGLEFALEAIHAVQLADEADGLRLQATASIAYPGSRLETLTHGPTLVSLLKKLLGSADFKGRRVIAALPAPELKILSIEYPITRDANESRVILEMAADRLPEPLTEYVLDYIPVRTEANDDKRMALVAVSKRKTVMDLLHNLRKARLDPHAIEIGPVAIRRLVSSLAPNETKENILLVNVGETKSFLTLISGRRLLMDQEVAVGQEQLLDAISKELDLSREHAMTTIHRCGLAVQTDSSEEERDEIQTLRLILSPGLRSIADEIEQAFGYAASVTRGAPSRKIYLNGSLSRWPGATTFLEEICGGTVELFPSPFSNLCSGDKPESDCAELAVATGLALRGMNEDV